MKIYPQDMAAPLYERLLRVRSAHRIPETDIARLTDLRKSWVGKPNANEDKAQYEKAVNDLLIKQKMTGRTLIVLLPYTPVLAIPLIEYLAIGTIPWYIWPTVLGCLVPAFFTAASVTDVRVIMLRTVLSNLHGEINSNEIVKLKKDADVLIQNYLSLLWTASQMSDIDESTERNMRAALRAIGDTIGQLPLETPETSVKWEIATDKQGDSETFRLEAGRLAQEANLEPDATIAASLQRQSDTLTAKMDALMRLATAQRRNTVLRQEIALHIETMRVTCEGYRLGGSVNGEEFNRLAANIQQVAAEAGYDAAARQELDDAVRPVQFDRDVNPEIEEQVLRHSP